MVRLRDLFEGDMFLLRLDGTVRLFCLRHVMKGYCEGICNAEECATGRREWLDLDIWVLPISEAPALILWLEEEVRSLQQEIDMPTEQNRRSDGSGADGAPPAEGTSRGPPRGPAAPRRSDYGHSSVASFGLMMLAIAYIVWLYTFIVS